MSNNINFDYKNLSPFKWFVLENFPFIEADFDALTEWQLFCKIGKEINKIINSQNIVGEQAETLTNAFNNLKNYVDNYFNNLDVQDEINNKLDLMASDGTLDKIINQDIFSQINNDITKNTADITKNTTDITKNTDDINKNTTDIDTLKTNQLSIFKNFKGKVCYFGDSYSNIDTCPVNWVDELSNLLGLSSEDVFLSARWNGSGFIGKGGAPTWGSQLQSIINQTTQDQRNEVSAIIIAGGFNDRTSSETDVLLAMKSFNTLAKNNFPNAMIYLAMIGWTVDITTSDNNIPRRIFI